MHESLEEEMLLRACFKQCRTWDLNCFLCENTKIFHLLDFLRLDRICICFQLLKIATFYNHHECLWISVPRVSDAFSFFYAHWIFCHSFFLYQNYWWLSEDRFHPRSPDTTWKQHKNFSQCTYLIETTERQIIVINRCFIISEYHYCSYFIFCSSNKLPSLSQGS